MTFKQNSLISLGGWPGRNVKINQTNSPEPKLMFQPTETSNKFCLRCTQDHLNCFLVSTPIAYTCHLRIWEGYGEGWHDARMKLRHIKNFYRCLYMICNYMYDYDMLFVFINIYIYIYIYMCMYVFLGTLTFCNITLNNPSVFVCRKPTAKLLESCLTWLIFANLFSTDWINCQQLPMALTFPLPTQVSRLSTRVGPHSPVTLGKRYYVEILNDETFPSTLWYQGIIQYQISSISCSFELEMTGLSFFVSIQICNWSNLLQPQNRHTNELQTCLH